MEFANPFLSMAAILKTVRLAFYSRVLQLTGSKCSLMIICLSFILISDWLNKINVVHCQWNNSHPVVLRGSYSQLPHRCAGLCCTVKDEA